MEVFVGSKRMSVLRSTSQRLATVKTSGCFRQAPDLSAALEPHPRSCTCSRCENRQDKAIKFRLPQSLSFPSIYILYTYVYIYILCKHHGPIRIYLRREKKAVVGTVVARGPLQVVVGHMLWKGQYSTAQRAQI